MTEHTNFKQCIICGTDCSNIPRIKDTEGNYYCQPCYDQAVAEKAEISDTPGSDMISCPTCETQSFADAVICTSCGYNFHSGRPTTVQGSPSRPSASRGGNDAFDFIKSSGGSAPNFPASAAGHGCFRAEGAMPDSIEGLLVKEFLRRSHSFRDELESC